MNHVISCFPNGVVEAVQNDTLPLHENFAGDVSMMRASEVFWDEDKWIAVIKPWFRRNNLPFTFSHKSREKCIEWEIEYLNNRTITRRVKHED